MATPAIASRIPDDAPSRVATRLEDFRVGGWLVRSSLGTAARDGREVHLRPQLVDLLLFLARQEGRVATRREIFAAVWAGQFVAQTCLARCVAELRQALGDEAKSPRLIETVLKRGYRLCQPVEWWRDPQPPAAVPTRPALLALAPSAPHSPDPAIAPAPPAARAMDPVGPAGPPLPSRDAGGGSRWSRRVRAVARLLSTDPWPALDRAMRRLSWRLAVRP